MTAAAAVGTAAILIAGAYAIVPMAIGPDSMPAANVAAEGQLPAAAPVPEAAPPAPVVTPSAKPTTPKKPDKPEKPAKPAKPDKRAAKQAAGKQIRIDLTGYSWHDNTPAGSAEVSNPIIHKSAGGHGTYADPITVAVPKTKYQPGTKFYLPSVQRYVIIEDTGASSASSGTDTHLDVWVDGRDGSASAVEKCMNRITGTVSAEVNPPPGRTVMSGPIYSKGGCRIPAGSKTD